MVLQAAATMVDVGCWFFRGAVEAIKGARYALWNYSSSLLGLLLSFYFFPLCWGWGCRKEGDGFFFFWVSPEGLGLADGGWVRDGLWTDWGSIGFQLKGSGLGSGFGF